ncbi:MAG TPA: hypothetical protein VKD25_08775 [Burkholderiales bacterium]|nr:hypothetical protein [Burkholderiales bacterium]
MNMALYRLLLKTGADEAEAEAAARLDTTDLATKADLAELKADLTWRLVVMTGVFIAAVTALRIFS